MMGWLTKFIAEAKKKTYASENPIEEISLDGTHHLEYTAGPFKYEDSYIGLNPFMGRELVWLNSKLIWGMSYYGNIATEVTSVNQEEIYNFLKSALRLVTEERPFRGPEYFENGNFCYHNNHIGSVVKFHGEEKILWHGKPSSELPGHRPLYHLLYFGGFISQADLGIANP